jgi:ATP-dependent RNA helicase DeaD
MNDELPTRPDTAPTKPSAIDPGAPIPKSAFAPRVGPSIGLNAADSNAADTNAAQANAAEPAIPRAAFGAPRAVGTPAKAAVEPVAEPNGSPTAASDVAAASDAAGSSAVAAASDVAGSSDVAAVSDVAAANDVAGSSDVAAAEAATAAFEAGTRAKVTTFEEIDLSRAMRRALKLAGYQRPTEIQAGVIPLVMDGYDVLGQARTGTGKTASFVIPILEMLSPPGKVRGVQAIILVPTRELAVQVHDEVVKLSVGMKVRCVAVYGGKPIRGQIDKLQRGAEIVVGTPGRVLDHLSRGTLTLHDVWCVVLDEADRMLDIGFRPDIEKILRRCPRDRQTLLLSATVPPPIRRLAERYMYQPEVLNFSPKNLSVDTIEQFYFSVESDRKFDLLIKLLDREQPRQAIIFCRTKRGTDRIGERLAKRVPQVACMHGDMTQGARDSVMRRFRDGELRFLVATDVVGRGIDISGISHIINFDIPAFSDDYVHRVGRTGRMGREGVAFTFVAPGEGLELTKIEQRIDRLLKRDSMVGFEPAKPRGPAPRPLPTPTIGSWDSPAAPGVPGSSSDATPAPFGGDLANAEGGSESRATPVAEPLAEKEADEGRAETGAPSGTETGIGPDATGTISVSDTGAVETVVEAESTFGQPRSESQPPEDRPPRKPSKRYRRAL